DALQGYAEAVHREAVSVLGQLGDSDLARVPPVEQRLTDLGGVAFADAPWLHAMWAEKPGAWFVRWELIGHAQGHVGEMVSVRDRLGHRPF
ncbi:MAG TPA: hypothetical protein VFP08_08480, partial [Acidimicrobiales bacterium]|nr:hypothetical protein [Acidimicrobiales bacterium]